MIPASSGSSNFVTASPVYGYDLKNIAITGEGVIDGAGESWRPVKKEKVTADQWKDFTSSGGAVSNNGSIWWPAKEAMNGEQYLKDLKRKEEKLTAEDYKPARDYLRPYMLYLINCDNVLLENVTLRNSPKFVFYPNSCTNLTMNHVNIFNEWWAQNGDGIDTSRCKNLLIYDCTVSAGDDGICMKSSGGKNYDAGANLENVVIAKCVVYHAHGGFVLLRMHSTIKRCSPSIVCCFTRHCSSIKFQQVFMFFRKAGTPSMSTIRRDPLTYGKNFAKHGWRKWVLFLLKKND